MLETFLLLELEDDGVLGVLGVAGLDGVFWASFGWATILFNLIWQDQAEGIDLLIARRKSPCLFPGPASAPSKSRYQLPGQD
ncbi:hypothetical protein FU323_06765 [Lactobacillus delbrueckii subsp. bulgaricus]|nr:hypothetical protein FU323_06765 [Lactobacillus delbrueckii subsp. bulgaricus]